MVAAGPRGDHFAMSCHPPVKVFLADDSAAIRQRVASLLQSADIEIVGAAATPCECVAAILAVRPDVVVLDVQLEGGTGLEVLQAVRSADPAVAFIVFSNNAADGYRKRYLRAGAELFLDKSREFDQLAGAVGAAGRRIH